MMDQIQIFKINRNFALNYYILWSISLKVTNCLKMRNEAMQWFEQQECREIMLEIPRYFMSLVKAYLYKMYQILWIINI